jgi:NADPH:quinone reductase
MRALLATAEPPHVELGETEEPRPLSNEALVDVHAVSLNRGELRRLPQQPPGSVPGWDVAGVVVRPAEDGSGPGEGARVVGLVSSGAWAERAAVPAESLAELPEEVSFTAAAALPVAGLTAYRILLLTSPLLGRSVLITGGAGGVGRFAVQLASRGGAHVVAVARDAERASGLTELGADEVVTELAPEGPRFDVLLESVGGASLAAALLRVAPRGWVVSFGDSSGGEQVSFAASSFYRPAHDARLYGFFLFAHLQHTRSGGTDLRYLAELVAAGELDPQVSLELGWEEAGAALEALLERRVRGKAVLHLR